MPATFLPGGRSAMYVLGGQQKLAQPAYDPQSGKQYQAGETLTTGNNLSSLLSAVYQASGTKPVDANSLTTGWAPQIGHITTSAATAKRRTNPLLAVAPSESSRKKNPFVVSQTPSADLFGLNIPV